MIAVNHLTLLEFRNVALPVYQNAVCGQFHGDCFIHVYLFSNRVNNTDSGRFNTPP